MDRPTPGNVARFPDETPADVLTDAEIGRLESRLFCAGGPPPALTRRAAAQMAGAAVVRAACKR